MSIAKRTDEVTGPSGQSQQDRVLGKSTHNEKLSTARPSNQSTVKDNPQVTGRPLTRKQEAFVREIIENPLISAKEAAKRTYNVTSDRSAEVVGSELLRKPEIMAYLAKYDVQAQEVVGRALSATKKHFGFNPDSKSMELLSEDPDHAIRLKAADSILDRIHGKATQRIEQHSTGITFTLDLTGQQTAPEDD